MRQSRAPPTHSRYCFIGIIVGHSLPRPRRFDAPSSACRPGARPDAGAEREVRVCSPLGPSDLDLN
jgi:hypothetical protein